MSKTMKFREWIAVPEAAHYLSQVFSESITEADLLRFGLDQHLVLSVRFVNEALVRRCQVIEDCSSGIDAPLSPNLNLYKDLEIEDAVMGLEGVWDLPMIGAEVRDIENRYQRLTGGAQLNSICLDGAFVRGGDGDLYQLQENKCDDIDFDRSELEEAWSRSDSFYPAGGLPSDSELVVRVGALEEFKSKLAGEGVSDRSESQVSTRVRDTLLKMVIGMAMKGYSHDPEALRSDAASAIAEDLTSLGMTITDDTVRKWLKEAASTVLPRRPHKT